MFRSRRTEDRESVHEKARRHVARGEVRRAIAALKEFAAANPEDDRTLVKLADLHRRCGDDAEAIAALTRAADLYAARGFASKVGAVLRQAAAIAPGDLGLLERLGEANAQLGMAREAALCLNQVTAALALTGERNRLVSLRRRILELLPEDVGAVIRLVDVLAEAGERDEAVQLLEQAAASHRDPAQVALWILLQERLVDLQPGNHPRAKLLARTLLSQGSPKRALARLKPCYEADPRSVETLSLLAHAFDALGLLEKAEAARSEIAQAQRPARHPAETDQIITRDLLEEDVELILFEEGPRDTTTAILDRIPADRALLVAESATHRDLAVAFVEMERYDEAIAELEKAIAADPFSEGACLALAGRCHLVRGAPRDAVDAYRRALASTTLSFEAASAVHYELAAALEATGAQTDSLTHRREAARLEPTYREVSDRIAALFRPS
jgi:tetratricopeptide (TPR) repeat protein